MKRFMKEKKYILACMCTCYEDKMIGMTAQQHFSIIKTFLLTLSAVYDILVQLDLLLVLILRKA